MICQRCRTGILSRLQQPQTAVSWSGARQFPLQRYQYQARSYSDGKATVSATPPPPAPRQPVTDDISVPSAVSSATPGVSQPFSTPGEVHIDASQKKTPKQQRPPSSCIAGSRMTGLNYFKNKPDVLALDDSEYPEWLWSLLDGGKSEKKGGVDPNSMLLLFFPLSPFWVVYLGFTLISHCYSPEQGPAQALRQEDGRSRCDPPPQDSGPPSRDGYHARAGGRLEGSAQPCGGESGEAGGYHEECTRREEEGHSGGELPAWTVILTLQSPFLLCCVLLAIYTTVLYYWGDRCRLGPCSEHFTVFYKIFFSSLFVTFSLSVCMKGKPSFKYVLVDII